VTTLEGFATEISWGYRLAVIATLNNAIGPVTLRPIGAFSHDVQGVTPAPIANFVEGRKILTLALEAVYLERLRARVSYTMYFGGVDNTYAGTGNPEVPAYQNALAPGYHTSNVVKDRDFISLFASYSF
jgi:hypothetical protein